MSLAITQKGGKSLTADHDSEQKFVVGVDLEKLATKILSELQGDTKRPKHIIVEFRFSGHNTNENMIWVQKNDLREADTISGGKTKKLAFSINCADKIVMSRIKAKRLRNGTATAIIKPIKIEYGSDDAAGEPKKFSNGYYLRLFGKLFKKYYNQTSVELRTVPKGRLLLAMKKIVNVLTSTGLKKSDARKYLKWAFENKANKVVLTIPLIASPTMISEFIARDALNQVKKEKKYVFR